MKILQVKAGDMLFCDDIRMEVLWPSPPFQSKADDNSLVLRYGDLLFLSDLPEKLESKVPVTDPVTVVRGAGSRECFSEPLLASTRRVIFSSSDADRDDLILSSTLDRLRDRGAEVWVTGLHGAVSLLHGPEGWVVRPLHSVPEPRQ